MSKCKSQRGVFWGGLLRLPTQRLHRGAAAILGIFLLVALATLTAITIDFGYIHVAETQLRRSADAAAMAGCWEVFVQQDTGEELDSTLPMLVVNSANVIASKNVVGDISPLLRHDDVELGNYHPVDGWIDSSISQANAVRVTLHRGAGANSELPLLFAALTGRGSQAMQATAVAAMLNSVDGFIEPPSVFETRGILPIALDLESWEAAVAASTVDNYQMKDGQVVSGSDGVFETDLYPGHRGTR